MKTYNEINSAIIAQALKESELKNHDNADMLLRISRIFFQLEDLNSYGSYVEDFDFLDIELNRLTNYE